MRGSPGAGRAASPAAAISEGTAAPSPGRLASRYRAPRRWSRSPGKWQEDPDESGFAEMEAGGKQLVEKEKMKTPVR